MKKFSKLLLAAVFATTVVAGVGCGDSKTTDTPKAEQPKEDTEKVNKAVFAAAVIAEEKLESQFAAVKGLVDGKEVSFMKPAKSKEESLKFLGTYWDAAVIEKEYTALLGDQAALEKANKAIEALATQGKKKFTPETVIAQAEKIRANALTAASKYEDAKVESKDDTYTLTFKGLTYKLKKEGNSYKIVGKEGTLAK
ncbi:hypothetical protein [Tumebacillus lipolyticus]|uniref:Lipoprotein n=1 Tax=Tumebacillus lipolyticus TaxID=1280370 RepID=A0ABW5A1Q7_9BACL